MVVQNLWGRRLHSHFEKLFHCLTFPHGGSFSLHLVWTSISVYVLSLSTSCHVQLWGAWFCLLGTPLILTWRAVVRSPHSLSYPKPSLLPAKQAHSPSLSYGASAPVLIVLVALHWSHCTLSMSFLYCRDQNWTQYTRCDLIVMDDLSKNIAVSKEKKTTVNIPLRKKTLPNLL